ncbi:hypothetical protein NKH77_18615 [Streptomyces sp. M19]
MGAGPAVAGLAPLVAEAARQAGASGPVHVEHVAACLANADLPVEEERLTAALAERGWGRSVTVANDTFALLRAGVPDGGEPVGVAVVCGAGINCAGLGPGGTVARYPRSAGYPATGAAAATCRRRRCGGPRAPRTAAANRPSWHARCPRTSA